MTIPHLKWFNHYMHISTFKMSTVRQIHQLIQHVDYALPLISSILIYMFLLLIITITLYILFANTYLSYIYISYSQLTQSMLARELKPSCALYWFFWDYILTFPSLNSISLSDFLFRTLLGYSGHVCLFTIWQMYWDPLVGSCFVTEADGHAQLF